MGRGNDDFLPKQESDFFARAPPSRSSGSGLDRQKTTPTEFLDRGRRKTTDRDEPLIARAGGTFAHVKRGCVGPLAFEQYGACSQARLAASVPSWQGVHASAILCRNVDAM
jgi:hypothetical protein